MDGRCGRKDRSFLRSFAFALSPLALASLGCLHSKAPVVWDSSQPPAEATAKSDGPKRTPHAETCVAFGDLRAQAARDSKRSPAEQEQMRDQARKAYQQALKIDRDCEAAYRGLGRMYQAAADHDRAVEAYQKGLKRLPKSAPLWYESGLCQARHKQWLTAIEHIQKAAQLDPDNAAYAKTLGFCQAMAGRYNESFASFRKVLNESQSHYNLARVLHYAGEGPASREHLHEALRLNPNMAPARDLLAQLDGQAQPPQGPGVVTAGFEQP